jgi:hypothetical protein
VVDLLNGPIPQYPVPRAHTQVTAKWIRIMPGGWRRQHALGGGAHGVARQFLR